MKVIKNKSRANLTATIVIIALVGLGFAGVKNALLDPLRRVNVLDKYIISLRSNHGMPVDQRLTIIADIQAIDDQLKKNVNTSVQTEWVRKRLINLVNEIKHTGPSTSDKSDPLALIAAEREQIKLVSSINTSFLQAIGSLFFLITAFATIRNLRLSQKNLEVSENKLTSEIIAKATDHLGSEALIVRLSGINTLIWVIRTLGLTENGIQPIIDTLAGFIVYRSKLDKVSLLDNIPTDIATSLVFLTTYQINAFPYEERVSLIRLATSNLSYRCFNAINLKFLDINTSQFDYCDLKRTEISKCNFNSSTLVGSDLSECIISETTFKNCRFDGAMLDRASIFKDCDFTSSSFGSGFNFSQIKLLSHGSNFTLSEIPRSIFNGLTLSDIIFKSADLTGASFNRCTLENVDFSNANLRDASFNNAIIIECNFANSNMEGVSLLDVVIEKSDFRGAKYIPVEALMRTNKTNLTVDGWLEDLFAREQVI